MFWELLVLSNLMSKFVTISTIGITAISAMYFYRQFFEEKSDNSNLSLNQSDKQNLIQAVSQTAIGYEFSYKSLDTAILVLRLARCIEPSLQNGEEIQTFFELLNVLERKGISAKSFENKRVIVLEGLSCSGKSLLIEKLKSLRNDVVYISYTKTIEKYRDINIIFDTLPMPFLKAFEFVVNYILVNEVMDSEKEVFIIEKFHHHYCVQNICERVVNEVEVAHLNNNVFEWPLDLPLPELV
jgi:hypothetical protein